MSEDVLRGEEFTTDGPVTVDVAIGTGSIDVRLGGDAVRVELRHDPSAEPPWAQGVSNTLSWLTEQFGDDVGAAWQAPSPQSAAKQTRIDMVGARLVVHAPQALPARHVPFAVTVHAPARSSVEVRSASARLAVTGEASTVDATTTAGEVDVGSATGQINVRTGGGSVSVGRAAAGARVRTGSGDVRLSMLAGSSSVATGSGSVRVASIDGELRARTGGGDITVTDAGPGSVGLKSGAGNVRVAVRKGTLAEIELSSATGSVSSDLDVLDAKPDTDVALELRARTGTGNVTITSAAVLS